MGAVGRPDLPGRARENAADLYTSIHEKLLTLPDDIEVYPGHFSGSVCGAGLSGKPMSTIGFHHLIQRLGKAAKMPFSLHPHMLRHACGYKLANDGHDTRALQHYLGHKNIQHTVRYTELSPDRFRDFWRD